MLLVSFVSVALLALVLAVAYTAMVPLTIACLTLAVALGLGTGAVFKLVPAWFPDRVGSVTGVVGAAGGLGGFFPPLVMGIVKGATGGYAVGFVLMSLVALACLLVLRTLRAPPTAAAASGARRYGELPSAWPAACSTRSLTDSSSVLRPSSASWAACRASSPDCASWLAGLLDRLADLLDLTRERIDLLAGLLRLLLRPVGLLALLVEIRLQTQRPDRETAGDDHEHRACRDPAPRTVMPWSGDVRRSVRRLLRGTGDARTIVVRGPVVVTRKR